MWCAASQGQNARPSIQAMPTFSADDPGALPRTLAEVREELVATEVEGSKLIERLSDKERFAQVCAEVGVTHPRTVVVDHDQRGVVAADSGEAYRETFNGAAGGPVCDGEPDEPPSVSHR